MGKDWWACQVDPPPGLIRDCMGKDWWACQGLPDKGSQEEKGALERHVI